MTIGELIRLLESYPSQMRVVVNGYEEGWDDLSSEQISVIEIQLNTGLHRWQGQHGDPRDVSKRSSTPVEALVLGRLSN